MEGKDVLLRDFNNTYIFPRAYKDNKGNIIADGLISSTDKTKWNNASSWVTTNGNNVVNHISDGTIHVTETEKESYNNHIADTDIHVTSAEKTDWVKISDIFPINNGIYLSLSNIAPTFNNTSWQEIGTITVGSNTLYVYKRIG